MTLVSFVVPYYNARQYLAECLASIVAMAPGDYEVVVVDDGSTEDGSDIAAQFSPAVRYLRQPNQGPGAARNAGIRATSGRYVRFLDADDYLISPEGLTEQIAILEANPHVGLVYGQALRIDAAGRHGGIRKPPFPGRSSVRKGEEEVARLLPYNYITTSSVMVRREVLEQAGLFRPDLRTGEDHELWLRIASVADIGYVATPVVAYRTHGASTIARQTIAQIDQKYDTLERLFEDPEFARRYGALRPLIEARRQWALAQRAYMHGEMASARGQARALIRSAVARGDWSLGLSATRLVLAASLPQPVRAGLRAIARRARGYRLTARGLGHG